MVAPSCPPPSEPLGAPAALVLEGCGATRVEPPSEIELKLEIAPRDLRRLRASPLLKGTSEKVDRLVSHYFDTPDHKLRRAGYTLRVREKREGGIQTVKQESGHAAGLFVRPEWEMPVKGHKPVVERDGPIANLVKPRELRVAFVTDVDRDARHLVAGGARIEVALDDGRIRANRRKRDLCELELELKGGAPEPLFALARELNAIVPLRIGVRSKAERGYALADGEETEGTRAEPVRLDPDGDARDGFATIAAACVRHFRLNEPILLDTGRPEPLHQSRVALRRLRSAFSSFEPLLAGDPRTAPLSGDLGWLAGELGKVRDLDVLIPKLEGQGRAKLVAARALALGEASTALDSLRVRELMIDLAEWLAIGAWRLRPAEPLLANEHIATIAADLLDRHRKRLKRRGHHLASLDDHHRHKARIEAKKLRYASEFFGSLWTGKKARRRYEDFVAALEKLQDHLGALNDQVTAADLLDRHGIDGERPRKGHKKLLKKAEKAFDRLMDATPFWA